MFKGYKCLTLIDILSFFRLTLIKNKIYPIKYSRLSWIKVIKVTTVITGIISITVTTDITIIPVILKTMGTSDLIKIFLRMKKRDIIGPTEILPVRVRVLT